MISFFGEQSLKNAVVERVKAHQRLDQIVQQIYWDGQKGCAIGCVLHSDDHMAFERQLGLPVFLAYLDEHIFESLPADEARTWPLRFIESVPVGVDLDLVFPRFMHWLLTDPAGLRRLATPDTLRIIDTIVDLYARRIDGVPFDQPTAKAASAKAAAAWSAAKAEAAAAWSAALAAAAARSAAKAEAAKAAAAKAAAAEAAEAEAAKAAAEAAWSAALAAARDIPTMIRRQADKLIEILQSYPSQSQSTAPCPDLIRRVLPVEA